jgi:hypothetical protein
LNRIFVLLALLVLVAAGCASGTAPSEEPTATQEPTSEPTPTESEEPSAEPAESLGAGAGELDDILPDEVAGLEIEYQHASGEGVIGAEGVTPEAQAFFDRIGAEASDLSSAFGFAFDQESGNVISIVAFRVAGADEDQLRTEFLATMTAEGDAVGEEQTVAGKTVQAFGGDAEGGEGYIYVNDDVVFVVGGQPTSIAEEALAALP